jgi:hypothetical protein
MVKDLTFRDVQKSSQEYENKGHTSSERMDAYPSATLGVRKSAGEFENTGVKKIEGGTIIGSDRKRESFGELAGSIACRTRRFCSSTVQG